MFLGEITALLASMCWTLSSSAVERKGKSFSSVSMNFSRQITAFIAIGILISIFNRSILNSRLEFSGVFFLCMSGLIGFSVGDSFLMSAHTRIGAQLTLLIFSLSPVLAAILGVIVFGEVMSVRNLLGMLIVIVSIMLVIVRGGNSNLKVKGDPKGLLFAFVASVGQALGVILSKAGMTSLPPLVATEFRLVGGIVGIIVICTLGRQWLDVRRIFTSRQGLTVNFFNSILGTTMGVVLSMFAIKYTKVAVASTLMSLSPIMIIPMNSLYFRERVTRVELIGAIMSVLGVALLV